MTDIIPGKTKFRAVIADSYALWNVVAPRGDNVWDCVVDKSDQDYGGTRRVFGGEQIAAALSTDTAIANMRVANRDFWSTREIGEILHYQDGNSRWVRGVVVDAADKQTRGRVLLPTSLVGDWRTMDLPSWSDSGIYREGALLVKRIAAGETFQPNASNIWEYRNATGQTVSGDPRGMEPIDLTPPAPTERQREAAALLEKIDTIRDAITTTDWAEVTDFVAHYKAQLEKVATLVESFEIEAPEASLRR